MDSHSIIRAIEAKHLKKNVADIRVGETVKVHYKIREGNKERVQVFEGLVIATKGGATIQGSFTVRKVVAGIGVERTFPLHSPHLSKIERVKTGKVRRARLNFVRRYALSSRFKLKDKGKPGTIWEDVAEEKAEIEKAEAGQEESIEKEVAPETDSKDNMADEQSGQTVGEPGGDVSGESAAAEEVSDSGPKPQD